MFDYMNIGPGPAWVTLPGLIGKAADCKVFILGGRKSLKKSELDGSWCLNSLMGTLIILSPLMPAGRKPYVSGKSTSPCFTFGNR